MHRPNIDVLELHITYRCNVRCHNCSNLCAQAPAVEDLPVANVEYLLGRCHDAGHPFKLITVHGGEPALHPQALDIARLLVAHRAATGCGVWWLTNLSTPEIERTIRAIQDIGINPGVAQKDPSRRDIYTYVPVNMAPMDTRESYCHGCYLTESCGIAYNRLGFWPCSPMAAAARVFGYSPAATAPEEIDEEVMATKMIEHCLLCGFAAINEVRVKEQQTSETWRRALHAYNVTTGYETCRT